MPVFRYFQMFPYPSPDIFRFFLARPQIFSDVSLPFSRCSRRSACANADEELHWLPYNKNLCISLRVNPDSLQRTDTQMLFLEINNLPPLER